MANNAVYDLLQNNLPQTQLNGFMGRLEAFRSMFNGDPKQKIQQMLNSGQISQAQYNKAVKTANDLYKMMGGRF